MNSAAVDGPLPSKAPSANRLERRSFLRGRFRETDKPVAIRPPWSSEARIAEACTSCGACEESCPENIIVMDADRKPRVDFSRGECSFCTACATACPEPVFSEPAGQAWRLSLSISETCLARSGVYCRSCGDVCAEGAVRFQPKIGGAAEIYFAQSDCTGCGACVSACPVGATSLSPFDLDPRQADV